MSEEKQKVAELIRILDVNFLSHNFKESTRGNNIMDLIMSNRFSPVHSYETRDTIMSYHKMICPDHCKCPNTTIHSNQTATKEMMGGYNFYNKEINWDRNHRMKSEFQETDWNHILQEKDTDDVLATITKRSLDICNKYVPKKTPKHRKCYTTRPQNFNDKKVQSPTKTKSNFT